MAMIFSILRRTVTGALILVDCTAAMIMEAILIVTGGLLVMTTTHVLFITYKAFKGVPDCIDIEVDVSEATEDARQEPVSMFDANTYDAWETPRFILRLYAYCLLWYAM